MLLEIFIKGIIVGLSISIPMGPVGMLIIQRTLNRGRNHGLATGFGATFSDILYSVVTLFFLSFVIEFIEHHRLVIQVVGSVVIILFGVWTYRSNPIAQPLPHEKPVEHSLVNDFITAFALTLSNPLILFVLIALFSHLSFISSETPVFGHVVGLIAVFWGAAIWWITLTFFVAKFRDRFNIRGLKLLNRITGTVIILLGVFGTIFTFV